MVATATPDTKVPRRVPSGPALVPFLVVMTCLTFFGIGAGGLFGLWLGNSPASDSIRAEGENQGATRSVRQPGNLKPLPSIVTNLAAPGSAWVRLEASVMMEGDGAEEALLAKVAEDFVAFLRTVSLTQIESGSGFQHLREDLSERARIRTNGRGRDLLIQAFIVE